MKKLMLILTVVMLLFGCKKDNENDISITIDIQDSIFYNGVKTEISASTNKQVESIEFYVDSKSIGSISQPDYKIEYTPENLKGGTHVIKCIALSSNGSTSTKEKSINCILRLGDNFEGGNIFYFDNTNIHGLISSNEDFKTNGEYEQLTKFEYGCYNKLIEANSDNGKLNTLKMADSSTNQNEIGYYFKNELIYNGYSDWYIPSEYELNLLKENIKYVNGFIYDQENSLNNYYWTSTESYLYNARALNMFVLGTNVQSKLKNIKVRLIRKF